MSELFIKVIRKQVSYKYKFDMNKIDSWENNKCNNMLDEFRIYYDESLMMNLKCQTVANIPFGRFTDTIAPGPFQLKCFVEPRQYICKPHGIINAFDLDGQKINENSIETIKGKNGAPISLTRWLNHDTRKLFPNPKNEVTSVAWSAGCFIENPSDLEAENMLFINYGIKSGDIIDGELIDE